MYFDSIKCLLEWQANIIDGAHYLPSPLTNIQNNVVVNVQ